MSETTLVLVVVLVAIGGFAYYETQVASKAKKNPDGTPKKGQNAKIGLNLDFSKFGD